MTPTISALGLKGAEADATKGLRVGYATAFAGCTDSAVLISEYRRCSMLEDMHVGIRTRGDDSAGVACMCAEWTDEWFSLVF